MNYIQKVNNQLQPQLVNSEDIDNLQVVDLFAGCGGLSLGFEAQGFLTHGFEQNVDCCASYNKNLKGICTQIVLTTETPLPKTKVLIGGPPCQPFSVRGNQKGLQDSRDGFPIFINAVKQLQPEIWLFENVKGLLYRNKLYFDEIITSLATLGYVVDWKLLNAVNFGVPQNRERLIVVGYKDIYKSKSKCTYKFPTELSGKVTAGEALGELAKQVPRESKFITESMDEYIAKYEKASNCKHPRDLHLDKPARTLTCRNLAGATSDMHRIKLEDGRRRRLFLKEAARLQSFPDWFEFIGSETSRFYQIGNAVSPLFAYYIAESVKDYLESIYKLSSEVDTFQ
jgi:DNA (cytosine-5)-methyltransferase 1